MSDHEVSRSTERAKSNSPLDEVHTAPYAAYAERILAGEVMGDDHDANPLSPIMNTANEEQAPELEPGSREYAEAELEQFEKDIEAVKREQRINMNYDDLAVVFDPELGRYVIGSEASKTGDPFRLAVSRPLNFRGTGLTLYPLRIPTCLQIDEISTYGYPLETVPDDLDTYSITGEPFGEVVMPKILRVLRLEHTDLKKVTIPDSVSVLVMVANEQLEELPPLPAGLEELQFIHNGNKRGFKYPINVLPASLKKLRLTNDNSYNFTERRKLKKRGIQVL